MIHQTNISVRYAETDTMGIVHHSNYPIWAEFARTSLLRDMGLPYSEVEKMGIMLPVTEMKFHFRSPAYFEDLIRVDTAIIMIDNRRLQVAYKIYRLEDTLCVSGYTKHIFMCAKERHSIRLDGEQLSPYQKFYDPDFYEERG